MVGIIAPINASTSLPVYASAGFKFTELPKGEGTIFRLCGPDSASAYTLAVSIYATDGFAWDQTPLATLTISNADTQDETPELDLSTHRIGFSSTLTGTIGAAQTNNLTMNGLLTYEVN